MANGQGENDQFRSYRREIWAELYGHLDAEKGWDGESITVRHGPFAVVLDVHAQLEGYASHVETRLRAPYRNRDGFKFSIGRRTWVSDLESTFGAQDIEIGDERFDREFVVKANNGAEVEQLLSDLPLRHKLLESQVNVIQVRDDEGAFGPEFPEAVDELLLVAEGRMVAPGKLEALYEVFADILDRLCQIGSAYEDDPNTEL